MSDEGQIKSIIERVQRLQEEKRTIEDDIKEVYAEARGNGYDVKVLRAVVKHLGKDMEEVAEFDAIFDLYLQSFHAAVKPSRAHVARDAGARTREAAPGQSPSEGEVGSAVRTGAPVSETATPATFPGAQSEAPASERLDQGADERAAGDGAGIHAQSAQFVTPTGEGEGLASPAGPSPEADEPIKGLAAANAIASKAVPSATAAKTRSAEPIDIEIPAFLRRTEPGNHPSFGEQA